MISPDHSRNDTGRRSFDFSEEDVETLKQITILRSFDFTIEEIRAIISDPNAAPKAVADETDNQIDEHRQERSNQEC